MRSINTNRRASVRNADGTTEILAAYNRRKLRISRLIDQILTRFLASPKRGPMPQQFTSILVVQSHLIGDLIMATPLLKALRKAYPRSRITLFANRFAIDLLGEAPFVDEIVTADFPWSVYDYGLKNLVAFTKVVVKLRRKKFALGIDAQIDMRNAALLLAIRARRRLGYALTGGRMFLTDAPEFPDNVRGLLAARLSILRLLGIESASTMTEIPVSRKTASRVESFVKCSYPNKARIVGIHPGASRAEKHWPLENYVVLIKYLRMGGFSPLLIESPQERYITEAIRGVVGDLPVFRGSLRELAECIRQCMLLICLDSAAVHIAGAVGTPSVAIYGPQSPALTKPEGANIEVVWNENLDCRPCVYGQCEWGINLCMTSISPEQVFERVNALMARLGR